MSLRKLEKKTADAQSDEDERNASQQMMHEEQMPVSKKEVFLYDVQRCLRGLKRDSVYKLNVR